MIIFKNKRFQTNSLFPNSDWTGKAIYVIKDDSELANKVKAYSPHYDFVLDKEGGLIDVVPVEYEPEETEEDSSSTYKERISDTDTMLVDHEYRLTLLELGVVE